MLSEWLRAPHRLRIVFLAVMLLLTTTLGWLGFLLLSQDRQLAAKRSYDQRDTVVDLAVAALKTHTAAVEQVLAEMRRSGDGPKDPVARGHAAYFQFQQRTVRAWPEGRLVYYPERPEQYFPDSFFAPVEELEAKGDRAGSLGILQNLARSSDPAVRAPALARLAAGHTSNGQFQLALQTYQQLAGLGSVRVNGTPAALVSRLGTLDIFEKQNDRPSLQAAARDLDRDLHSGRWPMDRGVYDSLASRVRVVLPPSGETPQPDAALAESVYLLWESWRDNAAAVRSSRSITFTSAGPTFLVWQASGDALAGYVAHATFIESQWLSELRPKLDEYQVRIALTDPEHRYFLGQSHRDVGPDITRRSEFPWTVEATQTAVASSYGYSRSLLLAAMVVLIVFMITAAWFIGYAVARELAVARLQSDFVSAVSHEFRTPLTTLCQLSELLKRGRVSSDVDRLQYYELLHHESSRLRRLVESLLNFGRLETGTLQFRFEELDASALVRQCVDEFGREQRSRGYRFEIAASDSPMIRGDRETLQCVFWNLLENAVKYSPECRTVWMDLTRNNGHVEIAVRDHGIGIPRQEQQRVFEKFIRGAAARASDVRGTGIGLALARQIVRAHGGEITVESEPGTGSTFRVTLPVIPHAVER